MNTSSGNLVCCRTWTSSYHAVSRALAQNPSSTAHALMRPFTPFEAATSASVTVNAISIFVQSWPAGTSWLVYQRLMPQSCWQSLGTVSYRERRKSSIRRAVPLPRGPVLIHPLILYCPGSRYMTSYASAPATPVIRMLYVPLCATVSALHAASLPASSSQSTGRPPASCSKPALVVKFGQVASGVVASAVRPPTRFGGALWAAAMIGLNRSAIHRSAVKRYIDNVASSERKICRPPMYGRAAGGARA